MQNEQEPAETTQKKLSNNQTWLFWAKKYWLSNLNKIAPVPYFDGADFKFVICFWKFWAQNA